MPRRPRLGRIYRPKVKNADGTQREVKKWWIAFYVGGSQVRESSRSTKYSDAEALLRRRVAEIETGTYAGKTAQSLTVGELLETVWTDYEINGKSLNRARTSLKHLVPAFAHVKALRVDTKILNTYVAQRRRERASNASINRELAFLKRGFNLAAKETPPRVRFVPAFPKLAEAPPRSHFLEYAEFQVLRSELPAYLKGVTTFGYLTGCRVQEILGLKWSQVDLLARVVRLAPGTTKNREGRTIPLTPELYQMIAYQKQDRAQHWPHCPFVFHRFGNRIKDFRGAWAEASKRAGLWDDESGKPRFRFHDLRRSAVRNLVKAGASEQLIMRIGGWKTPSVFRRYAIVTESDLVQAADRLESYLKGIESEHKGAKKGQTLDSVNPKPS